MYDKIYNGESLFDTDGNILHAHGGHMLKYGEYWYWYGENRDGDNYVSCYRSTDLLNWEFRANSLTATSKTSGNRVRADLSLRNKNGKKVNIERPKVLYNEKTGKFVMWAHYENGENYFDAGCAIATCDTPDGDFTYHGSFRPFGNMSRDCTLYKDDDGTAYFISASRDNADLCFYSLQDDYLNVSKLINIAFSNEYREAPALLKINGKYYLLTSRCTGWKPNRGGWSVCDRLDGEWSPVKNFDDEYTYRTQPAFILPLGDDFIYVGDRWGGSEWDFEKGFDYNKSSYYFSRLSFDGDELVLSPADNFKP